MTESAFSNNPVLPAEIVLAPEWWFHNEALTFDDKTLQDTDGGVAHAKLKTGWNILMGRLPEMGQQP